MAGWTVRETVFAVPLSEAVMVADCVLVEAPAVAEKLPEVAPAATVTEAGTENAELLELVSETTEPPVGAAEVSVTVHADVPPALTVTGLHPSDVGVTVAAVTVIVPPVAVVAMG